MTAAPQLETIEVDGQPCEVVCRDDRSSIAWVDVGGSVRVVQFEGGKAANQPGVWAPLPGSQKAFITCPTFEVLLEGTRGGGKTETMLCDYLRGVGQGYGELWAGILFRRTYPELDDVEAKSKRIFYAAFGRRAKYVGGNVKTWTFPDGETLKFRHMNRLSDYDHYHGHEYPWIGWEELTNWADDKLYRKMFSCCRVSKQGIPKRIRATTNPSGVGHNWVKDRFQILNRPDRVVGKLIVEPGEEGGPPRKRRSIHSDLRENVLLMRADPGYLGTLRESATSDAEFEAWTKGRWDIVAGGFFSDVWNPEVNQIDAFMVPHTWRIDRSLDWGDSAPFSVGWWAESDGSDITLADGSVMSTVRGDVFAIGEWYGWNGKPNEGCRALPSDVAAGIIEREIAMGIHGRVSVGPADTQIWAEIGGRSIAAEMRKPVRVNGRQYPGITWTKADKSPGSVENGLQLLRQMIRDARPNEYGVREKPGLFVFSDECPHFIRTVPVLPRCDKNPKRIAANAEDHRCDETRYRITNNKRASFGRAVGMV